MTPEPYRGAISLGSSKYASSQQAAQFAAFPAATYLPSPAANGTTVTIATKDQVDSTASNSNDTVDTPAHNADAQLAMLQNEALKKRIDKHSASFAKSVLTTMQNTRQLLDLIRNSIKKESPTADSELATVENIWKELGKLNEAAVEARNALPAFLDKQKENMSLYHSSVVNETMRESQAELDLQHKKINIQHSLILEHQQSFQDYKEQMEVKLKELNELKEKTSRLTLDKGLFKKELEDTQQQLAQAQASRAEILIKADNLRKETVLLVAAKDTLAIEANILRKTISELQGKAKVDLQETSNRYEKVLTDKSEQILKEEAKCAKFNHLITQLQGNEASYKQEVDKLKALNKILKEKFNNIAQEHSEVFTVSPHLLHDSCCTQPPLYECSC